MSQYRETHVWPKAGVLADHWAANFVPDPDCFATFVFAPRSNPVVVQRRPTDQTSFGLALTIENKWLGCTPFLWMQRHCSARSLIHRPYRDGLLSYAETSKNHRQSTARHNTASNQSQPPYSARPAQEIRCGYAPFVAKKKLARSSPIIFWQATTPL